MRLPQRLCLRSGAVPNHTYRAWGVLHFLRISVTARSTIPKLQAATSTFEGHPELVYVVSLLTGFSDLT